MRPADQTSPRRDDVLRQLSEHRDELHSYRVRSLFLFGSVARDGAGPDSDIDFLVEFDRPAGYLTLFGLKHYLEDLLGRSVDLGTRDSLRDDLRPSVTGDLIRVA